MLKAVPKAFNSRWFRAGFPLALGLLLLSVLAGVPLQEMSLATFLGLSAILSLLVFQYLYEVMLLKRHAYLSMLAQPDSPWRARLWHSLFATLLTALSALLITAGIWIAVAQLSWQEWGIFTASIISFMLLKLALQGWVTRHVATAYQAISLVRITHWLNVVLLCAALLIAHYWWLDVPDTRALSLVEAMTQAYHQQTAESQLKLPGIFVGINAALVTGAWHITQVLALTAPWWMTLLVWFVVVLGVAIQASMIWLPMLGLHSMVATSAVAHEPQTDARPKPTNRRPLHIWLISACIAVGSVWWLETDSSVPNWLEASRSSSQLSNSSAVKTIPEPCTEEVVAQQRRALEAQTSTLRHEHHPSMQLQGEQIIAEHVARAFASSEDAIDAFLDWNFSLTGQYTQLLMLLSAGLSDDEFEQRLNAKLEELIDAHIQPAIAAQTTLLDESLHELITIGMFEFNQQLTTVLQSSAQRHSLCWNMAPMTLNIDDIMHKSAVGAGVVPGLALMSRAIAPGSALLARTGTRRVIAMLSGRMAVRAGSSAGAATAGSVCGPLCMFVAGAATWIGTDVILNYTDESLHRDAMKAQLMSAVEAQQQHLEETLQHDLARWMMFIFDELEAQQNARFNVSRELKHN